MRRPARTLFFKCENFQRIGAFKARGAVNAVFSLSEAQAAKGVVTHSSGNHGAALAYAAARRGIRAFVVMPENTVAGQAGRTFARSARRSISARRIALAREAMCSDVQRDTGAMLIHPFDDADVIAGQGTAALELLEDVPGLEVVIAPIGGGGLLSGTAIAAKGMQAGNPRVRRRARERGRRAARVSVGPRRTRLADDDDRRRIALTDLRSARCGAIRAHVEAIGTASEEAIVRAMRMTWEKMKIVIEPSCAVPLACLLERSLDVAGRRVGIVLSGGNVDLDRLPWQA